MKNHRNVKIDLSLEGEEIVVRMDRRGALLLLEMVNRFEDFRRFINDDGWSWIRRNEYSWEHFVHLAEDANAFGLALNDELCRQKTGMTFEEWYNMRLKEDDARSREDNAGE